MLGRFLLAIVACFIVAIAPAKASPINIDPGDSNILDYGALYYTGTETKVPGVTFSDTYDFFLPEQSTPATGQESVTFSMNVIDVNPAFSNFGIANLTLSLLNVTAGVALFPDIVLTGADGVPLPGFLGGLLASFSLPSDIDLAATVTGTALSNGGAYNLAVAAIPLPSTLPLLAGGLGVFAVAVCRRRRRAA